MSQRTPYEVLGVKPVANATEIKAAYRRLVLKYHPDTSKEPNAADRFIEVTQAYEVLGDPVRRREYDRLREINEQLRTQARTGPKPDPRRTTTGSPKPRPQAANPHAARPRVTFAMELDRLNTYLARGQMGDAEQLARQILSTDPTQALPYAVLGDVARARGDLKMASKMYAYAAQFDPTNPVYLRKHEQLLYETAPAATKRPAQQGDGAEVLAPAIGVFVAIVAAVYVVVSREPSIFPRNSFVSTWTLGLVVMAFLSGVAMGASLAASRFLDRFSAATTTATGRVSPSVAFLTIALVNFWGAAMLYAVIAGVQRSYVLSLSRLMAGVAAVTLILTMGAGLTNRIDPLQVALWSGNLAYLGALCGWMAADSFRP